MLTFLLDKQDRIRLWQTGLSRPFAEPRMSIQTPFIRDLLIAAPISARASSIPIATLGTACASQLHAKQSERANSCRTVLCHMPPLRFAHCVRNRTSRSYLASKPCRSHT